MLARQIGYSFHAFTVEMIALNLRGVSVTFVDGKRLVFNLQLVFKGEEFKSGLIKVSILAGHNRPAAE